MTEETKPLAVTESPTPALLPDTEESLAFTKEVEELERWLSTPLAHNGSLAQCGAAFSILAATKRVLPATELDRSKGYEVGDDKPVIAYLCRAQEEWWHHPRQGTDIHYPVDSMFVILLAPNSIRDDILARLQGYLERAEFIPNLALMEVPSRTTGFSPAVTIVGKRQWKKL